MTKNPIARLGDVAEIERDMIAPEAIRSGTTYVGLENVESSGNFIDVKEVDAGDLASTKFAFNASHVLYGKLRPYLSKIARPSFEGVCTTEIVPIKPGPRLDRDFLFHYLRLPRMVDFATSRCAGANLPRLSPKTLADFEIPLPPLAEQKRIAAVLDQADALRAKRRQALATLDTLLQSIFLDMFGDPVTNPKGLPIATIGDVAKVATGTTPSRADAANYGGTFPWVKTTEVNGTLITDTQEHLSEYAVKTHRCRIHPKDSILVALYGQGKTRGQVGMLGVDAATNQACAVIYPSSTYDSCFVYEYLKLSYNRLRDLGRGGNQENLNLEMIRNFPLPHPPINAQRRFASVSNRLYSLRSDAELGSKKLDSLFASLQSAAFSGTLFGHDHPPAELRALVEA